MCIPLQNDYWNEPASSHHAAILGLSIVPVLCALCVTAPSRWIFSGAYRPGYLYHSIWNAHNAQMHYTVRNIFHAKCLSEEGEIFLQSTMFIFHSDVVNNISSNRNIIMYTTYYEACGGAVGWGTVLQAGRLWVRFPMVSLELFIDIILPAALWTCGRLSL
jgi:hypothetical protein